MEALSDALRFEVRPFGIDVVVIEPGPIKTRFGDTATGSLHQLGAADSPYRAFNDIVAQRIREAYDALRDHERRLALRLFGPPPLADIEALRELAANERRYVGPGPWLTVLREPRR